MTEDNDRLHQLRTMPYDEYLQTPEWLERREQALERADHRCQVCYTANNLNVHHRTYDRRGNERPSDLTVLCERHHYLFHLSEQMEKTPSFSMDAAVVSVLEGLFERESTISTGLTDIDRLLNGWQQEHLYVLSGYSESGKSNFLLGASITAAHTDKHVLFFDFETDEATLAARIVAWNAQIDTARVKRNWLEDEEWERLVAKESEIVGKQLWCNTPQQIPFAALSLHIAEHVQEHGSIDMLVIDNISFIEPDASKRESTLQQMQTLCRNLKQLAKQYHVPVLVSCPLPFPKEKRMSYKPTLADLRASNWGAMELYADVILLLYREDLYEEMSLFPNIVEAIVAKNRYGLKGEISLFFNGRQGRIENLGKEPSEQEL